MRKVDRHIRRRIKILQEQAQSNEKPLKDKTRVSYFFDPSYYTGQGGVPSWSRMMDLALTADNYLSEMGYRPNEYYQEINRVYMESGRNPDVIKNPSEFGINQSDYMPSAEDLASMPKYMRNQGYSKDEIKEYQKRIMDLTGYQTFQFKDSEEKDYLDGHLGPMTANAFMNYQMNKKTKGMIKAHNHWNIWDKKYQKTGLDKDKLDPKSKYHKGVYWNPRSSQETQEYQNNLFYNPDGSIKSYDQFAKEQYTDKGYNIPGSQNSEINPTPFKKIVKDDPKQDASDIGQTTKFDVIERIVEARCKAIQRKVL